MATNYSQDIKTKIECLDYNAIRTIYESINICCKKQFATYHPSFQILYRRGSISCRTDTYDEFIRDAYGIEITVQSVIISDYKTDISFNISYYITDSPIKKYVEITIYSQNINNISVIAPKIQQELLNMDRQPADRQKDAAVQLPSINVNVGGDLHMDNSAIGTQNAVSTKVEQDNRVHSKSGWWRPVWQKITANIIWWIIGFSGTIIAILYNIFNN